MINNKYVSFAFFTTFGIKASEQKTGKINITVGDKNIKIHSLGITKTSCERNILENIQKDIQKQIPLFFVEDYFIYELKINGNPVNISDRNNIKIEEGQNADIVLKKKLKLKEIKFEDHKFEQDLWITFKKKIEDTIDKNVDLTYATIFDEIYSAIKSLFKTGEYGIKLNNFEVTEKKKCNGHDKLKEGDEITVILDEKKMKEKAFSKFIVRGDKDIINIDYIKKELEQNFDSKTNPKINEIFTEKIFSKPFEIYKNDDKNSIKTNLTDNIPGDLKYFRVNVNEKNLNLGDNTCLKGDCILNFSKKGCKLIDENVLKSLEYIFNWICLKEGCWDKTDHLIAVLKVSCFINEDIDKAMISVKNQDGSDANEYNNSPDKIPAKIIIDLSPEAFIANQVKVVFEIKDVEKDGRKLKGDFKNKFTDESFYVTYGANKSDLVNLIQGIIPGITEGDIKLDGKALPENIKEGGVISIQAEKIPDENFEPKSKSEEEPKPEEEPKHEEQPNIENGNNTENSNNTGNGDNNVDNNKKNGGCCRSNKKN